MTIKLIAKLNTYCLLLSYTKSQYNPPMYGGIQQGYQYSYQNLPYPQYTNQRTYKNYDTPLEENRNYEDYNDYAEENVCPCDKCDQLKPFCKNMCPNCFPTPSPVVAPNYVFLPFPYPYPIIPNTTMTPVMQTTETVKLSTVVKTEGTESDTIQTITKDETVITPTSETITISNSLAIENNDVLKDKSPFNVKDKGQYMLTSLRRTKPNWLPKYGIVPISDKFAEKLMLQLRSMKVLHPQKDNMRNIDEITPLY